MKKKIAYCIFTAAFFIACLLIPSAGMLFRGESQPAANEMLAQRPQLILEDGTFNRQITDELTSYFAGSLRLPAGDDHGICDDSGRCFPRVLF